jgi:excisionase family DNA binding protein
LAILKSKLFEVSNSLNGTAMLMSMEDTNKDAATKVPDGVQQQPEVLNAKELGKILRIHPVTVRLKAAAGEIPGRQVGNRWRFSRTRINEWLMAA